MSQWSSAPGRRTGALLVALALAAAPGSSLPAATSTIVRAIVSKDTIGIGATVTVSVRIVGARDVGSVPFTIYFDPAILEYVDGSAVEGNFMRRDGAATAFVAAPGPASRGGGVLVGLSRLAAPRGASGKGLLCRLTFRARGPGRTPITFSRASVLDPSARPLEAAFRGSTIRVRPAQ